MSVWTYITGIIEVSPMGRTQAEKRYVLETVLAHLPLISGSKNGLSVHIVQKAGFDSSMSCDEFGQRTNFINIYDHGMYKVQSSYFLVINASLRNKTFDGTFRGFLNWICRLAKRVVISDVLIEIKDYSKSIILQNNNDVYGKMFENPSWMNKTGEPTWCEYLMWDRARNSMYPMILGYKYFRDAENDKEVERRREYL